MFSFGSAQAQDFKSIIQNHISAKNTFMKPNLNNFEIITKDFSKSMNADVVKVQQSFNGIPVYNAEATAMIKDAKVNYFTDSFTTNYNSATDVSSARANTTIFGNVAQSMGLKNASAYKIIKATDADLDGTAFAKTKLVYFTTASNDLRLCHEFVFEEKGTSNYWDILADAVTGEILSKENLTVSCDFKHDAYSHDYSAHTPEGFGTDF